MRKLAFLLWLFALPALAGLPHGSGSQAVVVAASPSATTMNLTWTSTNATASSGGCGTSPGGPYTAGTAFDMNSGAAVTAHIVRVAGLVASTTYFCQGIGGGVGLVTTATLATPSSTPLISVTFGTSTLASSGQNAGDSYYSACLSDGTCFVTTDDTHGWPTSGSGSNMMIGKFTNASPYAPPLLGANVNLLSNFGTFATCIGSDTRSPKLQGLFAFNGSLYEAYGRYVSNDPGGCGSNTGTGIGTFASGSILRSSDRGVTWCNFQAACDVNGSVPSPVTSTMFASSSRCADFSFIGYGPDTGTTLPTYRVDGADAYAYMPCTDSSGHYNNGDALYLARIPLAYLPTLDSTKIQYFTGGDGSLDANWSSSDASISPILSNTGHVSATTAQYMPDTGRYVFFDWYYTTLLTFTTTTWLIYEAPHPWGPLTLISTTTSAGRGDGTCGSYNPSVFPPSAVTATANGNPMTLHYGGDFNQSICYQLYTQTLVANTH